MMTIISKLTVCCYIPLESFCFEDSVKAACTSNCQLWAICCKHAHFIFNWDFLNSYYIGILLFSDFRKIQFKLKINNSCTRKLIQFKI